MPGHLAFVKPARGCQPWSVAVALRLQRSRANDGGLVIAIGAIYVLCSYAKTVVQSMMEHQHQMECGSTYRE